MMTSCFSKIKIISGQDMSNITDIQVRESWGQCIAGTVFLSTLLYLYGLWRQSCEKYAYTNINCQIILEKYFQD